MTAAAHLAVARVAIAQAYNHAVHARYGGSHLEDALICGHVAVRQLRAALGATA